MRLKVDLIVAPGTPQATGAVQATKTLPIVVVLAGELVATGLIQSLARRSGNLTGLTQQSPDWVATEPVNRNETPDGRSLV